MVWSSRGDVVVEGKRFFNRVLGAVSSSKSGAGGTVAVMMLLVHH